jgi:hypothetical protein
MYLTVIAWLYVVLMMSVVEAASPRGTVLGAISTFLLYGVLPLSIVIYIMGTGARRRARSAAQRAADATPADSPEPPSQPPSSQPDAGGHAPARDTASVPAAPMREKH